MTFRFKLAPAALALLCVACSGEGLETPRWKRLAAGFEPTAPGAGNVESIEGPGQLRYTASLPPGQWKDQGGGLWSAPRPALPGAMGGEVTHFLRVGEQNLPALKLPNPETKQLKRLGAGSPSDKLRVALDAVTSRPAALIAGARVFVLLDAGARVPADIQVSAELNLGAQTDGVWRVGLGAVASDGIPVLAGEREQVELDLEGPTVLRFQTIAAGSVPPKDQSELVFRLRLDGEPIFEHTQGVEWNPAAEAHSVILPEGTATLTFEVDGTAALGAFMAPVLGPAAIGTPGARPWQAPHPDVVFLLADTYRTDNLAAWGGDPAVAPRLNALASEGRRFLQTRTAGTWTLVSHASLFTGLYPPQNGVRGKKHHLAAEASTLAEAFAAAGYRTVAITDRGWVSRTFGLDQGFEWFEEEYSREFEPTLRSLDGVLACDDGRPLFLFIQSYRAHDYFGGGGSTTGEDDGPALNQRVAELMRDHPRGRPVEDPAGVMEALVGRYRRSSNALDVGFGRVLDRLERAQVLEHAIVLLTSDHGEAFGEHGVIGHGTGVWDDQAMVPLFIRGPGIESGDDPSPAGLVDVASTLAALAGVPAPRQWIGRDLMQASSSSVQFVFEGQVHVPEEVAVVRSGRKLILDSGEGPGELHHAYDLRSDPGETRDLAGNTADMARLWEQLEGAARAVYRPLLGTQATDISAEHTEALKGMGYLGDED
jgi:arylsulfatase A-like enzyme